MWILIEFYIWFLCDFYHASSLWGFLWLVVDLIHFRTTFTTMCPGWSASRLGPPKKNRPLRLGSKNHEHGFHMSRSYDSMWARKERYDIDIDYMGLWNEMPWGLSLSSTYWLLVPGASRRCDWGSAWYVFELAAAIKDTKNRCPAVSKTIQHGTKHCLSGC